MKRSVTSGIFAAAAVLLLAGGPMRAAEAGGEREEVAPGLYVGDVLGPDNWEKAKGLLPPEILKHYEKGEYRNVLVSYPLGTLKWEESFNEATERNKGRLDVTEAGSIVYSSTGKQPDYLYGIPFPDIDPDDPKAAVKIVWNQFFAYWAGGNIFNQTLVAMLQPDGMDREIHADGYFKFWDGQAEKYRENNPMNLQSQFMGVSTYPSDLQGTASLSWRYRDPGKRDSVWAFVPALRRVRAVSPANRSDGYLGSDFSGDDSFFFDGKPEDFTWKMVGPREALHVVDPNEFTGKLSVVAAEGGGWYALTNDDPIMAGFQDPEWPGVSWAPLRAGLAKRPMWVVRGKPKDKYYLYGELELWIDAETWQGSWNRKFNWRGELVHGLQVMAHVTQPVGPEEDREWLRVSSQVWACAENFKMNRATLGGMRATPKALFVIRGPVQASIFDSQSLVRYGK